VSGAQSSDLLLEVLQQAWVDQPPTTMVATPDADAAVESDADGCAIPAS
jgi:hypothetical protein